MDSIFGITLLDVQTRLLKLTRCVIPAAHLTWFRCVIYHTRSKNLMTRVDLCIIKSKLSKQHPNTSVNFNFYSKLYFPKKFKDRSFCCNWSWSYFARGFVKLFGNHAVVLKLKLDFRFQELDLSAEALVFNDSSREDQWIKSIENALPKTANYYKVSWYVFSFFMNWSLW